MDIEHHLLSKALREGDIAPILDAKVTPEWFQDDEHREVFTTILEHWTEYGGVLSVRALHHDFPNYKLADTDDNYGFYVDRLREQRQDVLLLQGLHEAVAAIEPNEGEPDRDAAMGALSRTLTALGMETSRLQDADVINNFLDRIARYRTWENNQGMLRGIPLGIPTIDQTLSGVQGGQLITFTGLPKSTKSFITLNAAIEAHKRGKTVLYLGFEMTNEEQEARHDAIRAEVSYGRLLRGALTDDEWARMERRLPALRNMPNLIFSSDIDSGTSVPGVLAKIEQYRPDIVFVDGIYMMDDLEGGESKGSPQALTNITRGLKKVALRTKLPVITTTQSLNWKTPKRGIQRGSIGYSSSFEQDSDVIIAIDNLEDDDDRKRVKILMSRVSSTASCMVKWDWQTTQLKEVEDDAPDDSTFDGTRI